jgi:ABC-type antimicrobial peptide transport system permease subunit
VLVRERHDPEPSAGAIPCSERVPGADVLRMVMREIVVLIATGLAVGIPLALWSGRWAASMLFGLKPTDRATISAAVLLLLAIAALAGYLPARRASTVDPMVALRYE